MIEGQAMPGAACSPDAWNGNTLLVKRMVDLFYAEEDDTESIEQAKSICRNCPARQECIDTNVSELYGVWGGYTATERASLRRETRRP